MTKNYWSSVICLGALLLVSGYQNCSSAPSQNPYFSSVAEEVCETDCSDADSGTLYVDIKTPNPYVIARTDHYFGVSGDCAGTGFDSVRVGVVLSYISTGQVMATAVFNCDTLGRYAGLIAIPQSYDHNQISRLVATAYGRSNGIETAGAATAQISIQSAQ